MFGVLMTVHSVQLGDAFLSQFAEVSASLFRGAPQFFAEWIAESSRKAFIELLGNRFDQQHTTPPPPQEQQ